MSEPAPDHRGEVQHPRRRTFGPVVLLGLMAGQALTAAVLLRLVAGAHLVRTGLAGRYPR